MLRRLSSLLPVPLLVGLVLFACSAALRAPWNSYLGTVDTHWEEGVTWWYWNIATNPFRGVNPLHNDLHAWPGGYDHFALIGSYGDALTAAPFFWLFEAPASYNLSIAFFVAFNALAAWWMFRRWVGEPVLAVVLAVATAFQPLFHFFIEEGRPTQLLFGWVYLAIGALEPVLREPETARKWPLVLGLTGSFVCFWFNGYFLYLAFPLLIAAAWKEAEPARRPALLKACAVSLGLAVLCAFPFGVPLLFDATSDRGIHGVKLFTMPWAPMRSLFSARPWEPLLWEPRYGMGVPYSLLVAGLIGLGLAWRRRAWSPTVVALTLATLLYQLLTLGPYLHLGEEPALVGGRLVALPWAWMAWGVPFYSRLSYPYLVFPFFLAMLMILVGRGLREHRALAWGLGALVLAEVGLRYGYTFPAAYFEIPQYYRTLAQDDDVTAILEFPFGAMDWRQVHQTVHQKPMVNSRGSERDVVANAPGLEAFMAAHPALKKLHDWQLTGRPLEISPAEVTDLAEAGVHRIIVTDQTRRHADLFKHQGMRHITGPLEQVFGPPVHVEGDLRVYAVQGP
jgi:hypothetical protein